MQSWFEVYDVTAAQQQEEQLKRIRPGSSLSPSRQPSSWNSPSGLFHFGFYKQGTGFLVGIWLISTSPTSTIVWTANRDDPPMSSNATLTLTKEGKLVLKTVGSEEKNITKDLDQPAYFASMLDSGNFVLCNNRSSIIWSSFSNPTDTLLGGQNLSTGSELLSSASATNKSAGRFLLAMQKQGELALYPRNGINENYWISNTWGSLNLKLNLSPTGVLQLLGGPGTPTIIADGSHSVKSMKETVIYRATLDSDGILRLYSHCFRTTGNSSETIEWSLLQNPCEAKGFCGANSFCKSTSSNSNSSEADCYCFPGFDFINPYNRFLGCARNFSDEGCKREEPADQFYNISDFEITKLGGVPYATLSVSKKGCREFCLHDCYCGAAVYSAGTCNNFKLPLMYGVKYENPLVTLFVKWNSGSANPPTPSMKERVVTDKKKKLITVLAACLGSITSLCFLIAMSSLLVYKLRVNPNPIRGNSNSRITQEFILRSFSYNELEQATNGFQEELGRGCFGAVYKGAISEGNKIIAVKRLENPVVEGERKFEAEMAAVRRTHHKNLVRLLGFCIQSSKKLLVYEFMSRGSLENLLFEGERRPLWSERIRIALDVARGVFYLHEECEVQIIHCDIKPRNILIDESWTAKISDFGLAKLLMPNQTGIVAGVRGSRGYMAPEWQNSGLITVKSDVYSFGVVLLEIVCCRSNFEVNVSTADEVLLSTWVYNCFLAGELHKLVREEKEEEEEIDTKTLERMVTVGLLCIQDDSSLRPSMKNVILMLEGAMPIPPFQTPLVIL
ncbi:putative Receptor-like protein kinase 1 [Melia azedarach]|uniref:Receptor-like protein kinase 1 n=1 Tax=Melia azedarach TaxID=155640 RepID=A0ACC1XUR4_MELAZ|nr:putative Receptor-like protein kinase 1 [Melia azedarach]